MSWIQDSEVEKISSGDPSELFGQPLEEVAARHANLVTGSSKMAINTARETNQILEATQVIAMSSRAVEVERDFDPPEAK